MDGQCHGTEVQEGTQEWTARYVHLVLVACAVAIFGVHLGAGLGLPLLASWFGRFEGWARYRVTPCLSRQTQKLMCLAALGLGSPLACQHLSWTSAVDLVLLIVQFVAQEVKGGAPVDDVALAVPLDLCFSFLLLGVAQGRIDLHFSWVLANLVMSFSVSSIPLVFGHKLPSGAASQGHFNSPSEHARAESMAGLSRNSSGNGRSTANGPSTVTDSSAFNSRRSSLHVHNHLNAAQLESLVQSQGGYSKPRHSQCGSSTSSVVEQLQSCHTPRMTAKPVHKLDRVTLPTDTNQHDQTSALIMRSNGMAIELLDKHGRSMHYTSRVRRQRVYIKTGVGGIKDARLQHLLPRVQHTLLTTPAQTQPWSQAQPQVPGTPGINDAAKGSRLAHFISSNQTDVSRRSAAGNPDPHSSTAARTEGTIAASAMSGAAQTEDTIAAAAASVTTQASSRNNCHCAGGAQSASLAGKEHCPLTPPAHAAAGGGALQLGGAGERAEQQQEGGHQWNRQVQSHVQPSTPADGRPASEQHSPGARSDLCCAAPRAQPAPPPGTIPTQHQPMQPQVGLAQQQPRLDCIYEHGALAHSQQQQQQELQHGSTQGGGRQQQLLGPPSLLPPPQQQQQHSDKGHAPLSQHQAHSQQHPLFGGVYVRDGCVEMTLDLLTFMASPPQRLPAPNSSSSPDITSTQEASGEDSASWCPTLPCHCKAPCVPPPLPLSSLGPGNWLDMMGLSHRLPQTHSQHAQGSSPDRTCVDQGACTQADGGRGSMLQQQQQQQQQQNWSVEQHAWHPCSLQPAQPCPPVGGQCSSRSSTSNTEGGASHYDPYLKLQLGEGEAVRTWRHLPQPHLLPSPHSNSPQPAAHGQNGGGGGSGNSHDAEALAAGQGGHEQQLRHPQQQQWHQEQRQEAGSCSTGSLNRCPDATPAAQLLGVYPHVVVAQQPSSHSGSSCSSHSDAASAPPQAVADVPPGSVQAPACPRVHLYVLLPGATASGEGCTMQQQEGTQSTMQQQQWEGMHSSPCSTQCSRKLELSMGCAMQQKGEHSIPFTARHQGRYLHARMLSSRVCPLRNGSVSTSAGAVAHNTPGLPALAVLEVELAAQLCPGLVHFEVCMPGMDAPSASACMLVVGQDCAGMAAELQQLQPCCEAQARQGAAARGWELVQQQSSSRRLQQQQQAGELEAVLAVSGRKQLDDCDGNSMEDACHCTDGNASGTRATPDQPLPPAPAGPQALLHDFGVWLELEGAAEAAAAAAGLCIPTSAANSHFHQHHHPQPPLQHALGPPRSLGVAPGSADLSAQFAQGMARARAQQATEVHSLAHHLAATANRLGWIHAACYLRASQHSRLRARHASASFPSLTSNDHSTSHKCPSSTPSTESQLATAQHPCDTHVQAGQLDPAGQPVIKQPKQSTRTPCLSFLSPAIAAVSPAFAASAASAAGQLARCAQSSVSAVAATVAVPAAAAIAATMVA